MDRHALLYNRMALLLLNCFALLKSFAFVMLTSFAFVMPPSLGHGKMANTVGAWETYTKFFL